MESTSKHPRGSGIKDGPSSPRKPVDASENDLRSAQNKNPIPPHATRE
jgi:hypothetical protein